MDSTDDVGLPKLLRGTYYKWTVDVHYDFIKWGETTAVSKPYKDDSSKRGHPNWDSDRRSGDF
jgi:hypothetical protein